MPMNHSKDWLNSLKKRKTQIVLNIKPKFHLYIIVVKKMEDVLRETNEKKTDATLSIVAYVMG